ncbi:MAG: hypothetical protein WBM06_12720, partial [Pseudolabrys sp.]
FTLNGYQPETERLEVIQTTGEPTRLRPNPVVVELSPAAPPSAKKPAKKPPPKRAAQVRPAPAPAPMTAAPAQAQSPWPTNPPPVRQ